MREVPKFIQNALMVLLMALLLAAFVAPLIAVFGYDANVGWLWLTAIAFAVLMAG